MSRPVTKVLCVDDHQFLADGLSSRLQAERDLEYAGWRGSADELIAAVVETGAEVVLLDIEMPGADPFEVLADLVRDHPKVKVIMLSAYVRDRFIDAAVKAGAWGYLSKSDEPQSVIEAIRTVLDGKFAFGPAVLERCQAAEGIARGHAPTSKLDCLTGRELQVLRFIGKGLTRQEIASTLHRSPKTIDNHRAAIMEKLGIHDRVDLVRYAIQEGLTDL